MTTTDALPAAPRQGEAHHTLDSFRPDRPGLSSGRRRQAGRCPLQWSKSSTKSASASGSGISPPFWKSQAAIGLLFSRYAFYGAGLLCLVMVGAITAHLTVLGGFPCPRFCAAHPQWNYRLFTKALNITSKGPRMTTISIIVGSKHSSRSNFS